MSAKAAKDGKTTCKITATLRLIGDEFTPDAAEASPVIVVGADATHFAEEVTFAVSAFSGAKFE